MTESSQRSLPRGSFEVVVGLAPDRALQRLKTNVAIERPIGGLLWDSAGSGYVGSFTGRTFRIRVARHTPQFYATHVFGRVEERPAGAAIIFRFGRRAYATWALWIIRIAGVVLIGGSLLAALRQPVFALGAAFVAVGIGSLLWLYRLRTDDKERLHSLIVASSS